MAPSVTVSGNERKKRIKNEEEYTTSNKPQLKDSVYIASLANLMKWKEKYMIGFKKNIY